MKRIIALLLAAVLLQYCSDDQPSKNNVQKVQFLFSPSSSVKGGRTKSAELPSGSSLSISIEKNTGESVFSLKKLALLQIGSDYISETIELPSGDYRLTDFLLVDSANHVLFATPKSGSPLADLVANALPYSFVVGAGQTLSIIMEVVDATDVNPSELGYVSFGIEFVYPIGITVFATENASSNVTDADAYVIDGTDTVLHFSLEAGVTTYAFTGDATKTYSLHTIKPGFARDVREFNYSRLKSTGGLPLLITLPAAFTLISHVDSSELAEYSNKFSMSLDGPPGKSVTVDWGDGITLSYAFDANATGQVDHQYARSGNHFVCVTGDIDQIAGFYSYYGGGPIDAINTEHLPLLSDFRLGITRSPRTVDLSHNPLIAGINMIDAKNTEFIILSQQNEITGIDISGPNLMSAASVNNLINLVYNSAVAANRHSGGFLLRLDWTSDNGAPLVPLSARSKTQLKDLSENYQWYINPYPL